MKKMINQKKYLIVGLVLTVVLMNLPVILSCCYHHITGAPVSIGGRIDLSGVDKTDKKIYLDGQWEFYWNNFIISDPERNNASSFIIEVPGSWSNYSVDGEKLPAGGYGSYRLVLDGLEYDNTVTLYIPDYGGAYQVFIDGQLASKSGIISSPRADLYPVRLSADNTHEVVIEVSTTRFSGLYMTPVLGDYDKIISNNTTKNIIRFILFGFALFSFFSLIFMYAAYVRRKLNSFWMPVMIFLILIRMMLTSEFYSFWQKILFFNLSYESTNELMYLTTFTLKYLLIYLVEEQCGINFKNWEKKGFLIYYIVLYLTYLFVPNEIYNHYPSVIIPMLTYILDIYLFVKIYRNRQRLEKFGMVIYWSLIIVILGLTIDSYYINGKIYMDMSVILLLFFTLFSSVITLVYSMRAGDLYDDFTQSSSRLEMANKQLKMQKEYYIALSGQMSEIREIKHDFRHFIGVMLRLAEEDKIYELKKFLYEYVKKTEMKPLPVFCENVVANSIIGYYYLRANESGIPFEVQCSINRQAAMSDSDLCIVLGNAIDNAIEACRKMDNSEMSFISVQGESVKGQWLLKVKNAHNSIPVIRNGNFISSKEGKFHGLGIRNIEKVVESYGGFLKIEYDDKVFSLMAALPEKENKADDMPAV